MADKISNNNEMERIIKESLVQLKGSCNWVLHDQNKVLMGQIKNSAPIPDLKLETLKEFRLFSEKGELHIWKYGNEFKSRLRIDNDNEKGDIYQEKHFTWGSKRGEGEFKNIQLKVDPSLGDRIPKKYLVYNYFDYDQNGLIKFYDARLVKFIEEKEGENNG